ncbi:TPA: hypothetical protein U0V61_001545 [Escherichia coli]|nr:hypothetical protein [Escherichia coli]MED9702041.1 hypothetical protein [Escherichia coli]HAY0225360.1 hypothetical protein [Escherichia coli]HEL8017911.1 hypothetical protein [Escherichia coli]HEL8087139.1 hypothetical protein [Escherichia coli]
MKFIQHCTVNGEQMEVADISLLLALNAAGRGFVTVNTSEPEKSLAGAMVQIDLGRDGEAWRYFSGYAERDQPAENGARRMFIREAAAVLDFDFPVALQHPTLQDVLDYLGNQSGIVFITGDAEYATTPVPYVTHSGSGIQLLNLLGRTFSISDYVWHPMPDGSVFVGSADHSRFASLTLPEIPSQYALSQSGGNSMDIMPLGTLRPGVNIPAGRITRVALNNGRMSLTWERPDISDAPTAKSPLRRQMEAQFPELASGTLRTQLARVTAHPEPATLGDVADDFRPRYAVDVQLLDEDGNDKTSTPVYPSVPLPVPMGGSEAGCFAYPPVGTLVEITHVEGRPDRPVIRQILPSGQNLPAIKPGEQLQQQRAEVFQRVTTDGSWQRETDQQIQESSATRSITSDQEERTTTTRTTTVQASDTTTVLGNSTLMAGQVLHVADGDYAIVASESLHQKARALLTELESAEINVSGNLSESITGQRSCQAGELEFVASSVFIGRGGQKAKSRLNLLTLLMDILELIQQLASHTASHTHSNTGTPTNSGDLTGDATQAVALNEKYRDLIA